MDETQTPLAVQDLVSTTSLGLEVLAGTGGLSREVLWAHSCELKNPEQWLGPHELLMTVGLCVPTGADEQVDFLGRLDDAGLAGMVIGDHETAPEILPPMLAEADRRSFPVLMAATEIPYAAVSRHVAAATSSSQIFQVLRLSKLYQIAANADDDTASLVREIATLLRVGVRVDDSITGMTVLEADLPHSRATPAAPRSYPLRGAHSAELWITEYPGEELDSFILVHLVKILQVNVDRVLAAAGHRAEAGSSALRRLLTGAADARVDDLLGEHQAADGFRVAAFAPDRVGELGRRVALSELPVLVGEGRTSGLALMPHAVVPDIQALAERTDVTFGASSLFTDYRDVRAAAEEAIRVLTVSQYSQRRWIEFEGSTLAVLSRSHQEAEEIIAGVLGPLAESSPSAVKLRETLFAYLRNDRRWKDTSAELGVHRQTLSYRLNRIEEETGMSLSRTADLSAFWVAYQAWEANRPD